MSEKKDVRALAGRYLDRVSMHLDAWASLRLMRAGGASAVEWEDVFPGVEPPSPLPFPANARGETIVHPDEVEAGSELKYQRSRQDSPSIESMAATVERAIARCDGDEESLRRLLFTVHPECGRCRPDPLPPDPFWSYAEAFLGPQADKGGKWEMRKLAKGRYSAFRKALREEIGAETVAERSAAAVARAEYVRSRRNANESQGRELSQKPEPKPA